MRATSHLIADQDLSKSIRQILRRSLPTIQTVPDRPRKEKPLGKESEVALRSSTKRSRQAAKTTCKLIEFVMSSNTEASRHSPQARASKRLLSLARTLRLRSAQVRLVHPANAHIINTNSSNQARSTTFCKRWHLANAVPAPAPYQLARVTSQS